MKKNYEIKKSVEYRNFSEAELAETATSTALIIDDADFGYMGVIPKKNKEYAQMWLSEKALEKSRAGMVVELTNASILTITTSVVYDDPSIEGKCMEEIFLDF